MSITKCENIQMSSFKQFCSSKNVSTVTDSLILFWTYVESVSDLFNLQNDVFTVWLSVSPIICISTKASSNMTICNVSISSISKSYLLNQFQLQVYFLFEWKVYNGSLLKFLKNIFLFQVHQEEDLLWNDFNIYLDKRLFFQIIISNHPGNSWRP